MPKRKFDEYNCYTDNCSDYCINNPVKKTIKTETRTLTYYEECIKFDTVLVELTKDIDEIINKLNNLKIMPMDICEDIDNNEDVIDIEIFQKRLPNQQYYIN